MPTTGLLHAWHIYAPRIYQLSSRTSAPDDTLVANLRNKKRKTTCTVRLDTTSLEVTVKNVGKVSFASDIRPLFRSIDIEHMKGMDILLDDYAYMSNATNQHENARRVYDSLTGKTEPRMPPNGPYWPKDKLDL